MSETPVFSRAAAAAPSLLAAEAGRAILLQGGNALESMVAMAATIAVVYPHMNGLGGDGFWLIREPNGKVRVIEACGFAGRLATPERYRLAGLETIPPRGPQAALTVPGTVGGWALALELSSAVGGRLPLALLLDDAIGHARDGYPVSPSEARFDATKDAALIAAPGFTETYFVEGKPAAAGVRRKAPPLAETLAQLAHAGLGDFYRGDVAREIAADLERIGAPVTREDLKAYSATWRQPLSLRIDGATLYNSPPPTQGLASLIVLGLYERLNVKAVDGFAHFHALIEASKRALAIRDAVCTDFAALKHDVARFLAPEALDREAAAIDSRRASGGVAGAPGGDTVWMSAIDREGRAVSFIQSVYWEYGSGCVLPRTGVLMQNRGVAFSLEPGAVNPLRPGRRPFHTLNPPLAVFDDGRVMAYGSMGGDGQPQFQAQILTHWRGGRSLADAIDAPRFLYGRTWGSPSATVKLESGFDEEVGRALERAGHPVEWLDRSRRDAFGHAGALLRRQDGAIEATHDPRSDGGAAGF